MAYHLDMDPLHSSAILLVGAVVLLYIILSGLKLRASNLPAGIVWIGCREEVFSTFRAYMHSHTESLRWLTDGYNTFSRKGVPFVIPTPALRGQVMLPQEHISWLADQSDSVFSVKAIRKKNLALEWLLPTVTDPIHDLMSSYVLRRDLTRNLGKLQPDIFQEMRQGIEATMGVNSEEWHEICLFQTMQEIVKRVAYRVLYGLPLSQDADFGYSVERYKTWIGTGSFVSGQLTPWPISLILASLAAVPIYFHKSSALKAILPEVKRRFESIKRKKAGVSFASDDHDDFMTWHIEAVLDSDMAECLKTPEVMADRLVFLSLAADHTVVSAIVNVLFDLLSANTEQIYYQRLRSEADSAFPSTGDWLTPASVTKLALADSAIRESMRRNPSSARSMMREVVQKGGVTLPDGTHLPNGAWVGAPMQSVHFDERFYPDPEEYKPFRFDRSMGQASMVSDKDSENRKNMSLVTTSDIFMTWGHGRHACPGRWFATHLLKMMLAYITLNYDMEPLNKRPLNNYYGDFNIPSQSATIKVRRRKGM